MTDTWDEFIKTELMEMAKKKLEAEGWTPPKEKEPEFKEGDYVLVKKSGKDTEYLGKYEHRNQDGTYFIQESGLYFKECKHAPSWLKPESGPSPDMEEDSITYEKYFETSDGRYWLSHRGKWYWLPFKD